MDLEARQQQQLDSLDRDAQRVLLHDACSSGATEVVRTILMETAAANGPNNMTTWLDARDSDGDTLLFVAARNGHLAVVKLLCESGASVDARILGNDTPLLEAAGHGHLDIVHHLLELGADVDAIDVVGVVPLLYAAQEGHVEVVQVLLAAGASVDCPMHDGTTPLAAAVMLGHIDVVRVLCDAGANVDFSAEDADDTPLFTAVRYNRVRIAQLLLAHGADVGKSSRDGCTPLWRAAQDGKVNATTLLLAHGASVDAADSNRATPLYYAASKSYLAVAALLLEHGATVDLARHDGATPLYIAAVGNHVAMLKLLLQHNAGLECARFIGDTPLWAAVCSGSADAVRFLLAKDASVDAVTPMDGQSVVHVAAMVDNLDILRAVLEQGASVHSRDNNGWTPLHYAAVKSSTDTVQLLLEHGAAVDARATDGATPLYAAASKGRFVAVFALTARGADVNAAADGGQTPLIAAANGSHAAVNEGHVAVIRVLLDAHAAVDSARDDGATALYVACASGESDVARMLIERGADVKAATTDQQTPLHAAATSGHVEIVTLLLDSGRVRVDAVTADGETPLLLAARNGHFEVVRVLLSRCSAAEADAATTEGVTPLIANGHLNVVLKPLRKRVKMSASTPTSHTVLYEAAAAGHDAIVELLLANGARVDVLASDGTSPLAAASRGGHLATVQRLLEAGAAVDAASANADTPLLAACRSGHLDVARQLLAAGASIDSVNGASETPLLASAGARHFGVALMLLECGATPHVRAADGETVLTHAARSGDYSVVSTLVKRGAVRFDRAAAGTESLLRLTLQTLQEREGQMHEFATMWRDVVDALVRIHSHCNAHQLDGNGGSRDSLQQFVLLVLDVARMMDACTADSVVSRVVAARAVMARFHDCWRAIACLERVVGLMDVQPDDVSSAIASDCASTTLKNAFADFVQSFSESLHDAEQLETRLSDAPERVEAIALLEREIRLCQADESRSAAMLTLLQHALDCVQATRSSADLQSVPQWFIPPRDLKLELGTTESSSLEDGKASRCVRATWLGAHVNVKQFASVPSTFADVVTAWYDVRHPNVAPIYGASHVRAPYSVVLAPGTTTNVRAHLAANADEDDPQGALWPLFLDAARGLQYLHARGIFLADLRCAHIQVSSDGSARINVFGGAEVLESKQSAVASASEYAIDAVRWRPRECTFGDAPSSASNVYALAMCILEAMTNERPWGDDQSSENVALTSCIGYRPDRPARCSEWEWSWIRKMMLDDPSMRPSIADVVELIEGFVRPARQQPQQATHASAAVDCERATAVEQSLESTIPLHELEWNHSEASSELRRATWLSTPVLVQSVDNDDRSCETVTHMLRHPHVLEQYGWADSRDSRYVVYEDASNGTLTNYLARLSGRNGANLWRLLYEAALGLQHLHDQHVVHTDIACSSIVIDSNGVAKLACFGSVKAVGWQWRSPEHMRGDQQTRASDIYSFGMCILEAATGHAPWHAASNDINDVRRRVLQGELPPRPDSLSARHWRLIEMMCAFAPQQRVTIATVVQWLHAFAYE